MGNQPKSGECSELNIFVDKGRKGKKRKTLVSPCISENEKNNKKEKNK